MNKRAKISGQCLMETNRIGNCKYDKENDSVFKLKCRKRKLDHIHNNDIQSPPFKKFKKEHKLMHSLESNKLTNVISSLNDKENLVKKHLNKQTFDKSGYCSLADDEHLNSYSNSYLYSLDNHPNHFNNCTKNHELNSNDNKLNEHLNDLKGNETECSQTSNQIKSWLTSHLEIDDLDYWKRDCERLETELNETLDKLDELDEENEILSCEFNELSKLSNRSLKLKKLLKILDI